jgi:hypothetical protein
MMENPSIRIYVFVNVSSYGNKSSIYLDISDSIPVVWCSAEDVSMK